MNLADDAFWVKKNFFLFEINLFKTTPLIFFVLINNSIMEEEDKGIFWNFDSFKNASSITYIAYYFCRLLTLNKISSYLDIVMFYYGSKNVYLLIG